MLAKLGTLKEVECQWTICDLYDAHEALDIKHEIEEYYRKKANP